MRGVEQREVCRRQIHVAVVCAVFRILQEAPHDGRRDHVADILRDIAPEPLEGDADDFAVLHHGSTAVAGIDGSVDLDGKVAVHLRVAVSDEVDARDDTARD